MIEEVLFQVNDVVPVGSVIARIKTEADAGGNAKPQNIPSSSRDSITPDGIIAKDRPNQYVSHDRTLSET